MKRKTCVLCVCMLLLLASFLPMISAAGPIETEHETSLTLLFKHESQALEDVAVRLYRTADVSETAQFTLAGDYAEYPVRLDQLDDEGWKNAANTLATYTAADSIPASASGKTDGDGSVLFSELRTGLYLVVADALTVEDSTYSSAPFLISLPNLDADSNWIYDVTAFAKLEKVSIPEGDKTDIDVVKVWKDDGNKDKRPDELKISLLKNGSVYAQTMLNAKNSWQYSWKDLEKNQKWTVIENNVPKDYTVAYSGTQQQLVITNTYKKPGDDIPNTGQLWWPIPLLAIAGVLLFAVGWYRRYMKHGA